MNEYYELLGLLPEATDEEIRARYEELKKKYREEMWQDGDAGTQAAKMLGKLDVAFAEINNSRHEKEQNTEGTTAFEEVSSLLKEGKINEAQAKLDDFNERSAEWHYLQAVVFYKKSWNSESKKQLEIAIQLDPENKKYRSAYGKLNQKTEYEKQTAHAPKEEQYDGGGEQMGGNVCSNCLSCCYTMLCVDCLYTICCGCRQ
jgi:tetratricopeptide (TPR) repeat protein